MPMKLTASPKAEIFGLVFRAGTRRWFWGWGVPRQVQESSPQARMPMEQSPDGRWGNVAEWLRRMHAEADRPSTTKEQKQNDRHNQTQKSKIKIAGLVCFWRLRRKQGESRRERFFSVYEDLRKAVKQNLPSPVTNAGERRWNLVRISAPGRWFLGFGRR